MDSFQSLVRDAQDVGIIKKKEPPNLPNEAELAGLKLCEELAELPFWCDDKELHIKNPDYKDTARCCTTHIIGLPRHSSTNEEMALTPYQVDFANKVIHGREKFGDKTTQLKKSFKMHIKKGRQMGFTEIVLRLILHFSFNRYAGANVAIIAATNGALANEDLRRLAILYKSIPSVVEQWIKNRVLRIVNGCIIEAFSASEEAMTGRTNYKCVLMDESAKWRLENDTPVFSSIIPIVDTNGADLYLVSTPKGPLKEFYKIDMTHDENDFTFFVYDIWQAKGNLYSEEKIRDLLNSSTGDPDQEYLCIYTSGEDSIFGVVSDKDKQGKPEWGDDDYDEEKDKDGIYWHED